MPWEWLRQCGTYQAANVTNTHKLSEKLGNSEAKRSARNQQQKQMKIVNIKIKVVDQTRRLKTLLPFLRKQQQQKKTTAALRKGQQCIRIMHDSRATFYKHQKWTSLAHCSFYLQAGEQFSLIHSKTPAKSSAGSFRSRSWVTAH